MSLSLDSFLEDAQGSERIVAIAKILSDGKPHKAGAIAFQLGVHSRTIRRDLHIMRDELNLPIDTGRKGFFAKL